MNKIFIILLFLVVHSAMAAQNRGYMNINTFGVLAGTSADEKAAPLSILTEHLYRFNNYFAIGIMTGIEQFNENAMPVALNFKSFLPAGKHAFFLTGLGGYSVSLEKPSMMEGIEKAMGGFMAGVETGLLIRVNSCSSVAIAVGYRHNVLNYKLQDWYFGNYERRITYNRFAIRIGFAIF